jgi:hypothetical protein
MFGLDDFITSYSDGAAVWIVVLVAVLVLDRFLPERVQQLAESASGGAQLTGA